ncbi:hypothetical protein RHIZ404_210376 [Rhizobium sp. EC-SD404]|nr:hypothetical protein RHIZ404_210376 [Rhizobium sp. EC-SD404]
MVGVACIRHQLMSYSDIYSLRVDKIRFADPRQQSSTVTNRLADTTSLPGDTGSSHLLQANGSFAPHGEAANTIGSPSHSS